MTNKTNNLDMLTFNSFCEDLVGEKENDKLLILFLKLKVKTEA